MTLSEILSLAAVDPTKMKIHMAIGQNERNEPWIRLSEGRFKEWQERQNQKNFQREMILSFVFLRKNEWLFAGIYSVDGVKEANGRFEYTTTRTNLLEEFVSRLVVFFEKDFRANYLKAEEHVSKMHLLEIHREKLVCDPFPG